MGHHNKHGYKPQCGIELVWNGFDLNKSSVHSHWDLFHGILSSRPCSRSHACWVGSEQFKHGVPPTLTVCRTDCQTTDMKFRIPLLKNTTKKKRVGRPPGTVGSGALRQRLKTLRQDQACSTIVAQDICVPTLPKKILQSDSDYIALGETMIQILVIVFKVTFVCLRLNLLLSGLVWLG